MGESNESDWEREQRFWREHPIDRFDLDECGSGYMRYRDMRLNDTGEWIRAEDHRKAVEDLATKLIELRSKLEHEEERRQHAIEAMRDDDDPGEALALLEGRRSRG